MPSRQLQNSPVRADWSTVVSWWGGRSGGTETTRIMTPVGIGDMHLV
jgi:hypothetical protein